ncbi:unnamed protein product, partial [Prorocentrum cordatum]
DILIIRSENLRDQAWVDIRAAAGKLWIENYGKPRHHTTARMDKGIAAKAKPDDRRGEAHFTRELSKIHQSLNGEAGRVLPSRHDLLDVASLTDKQIAEFKFNDRKEATAQAKALLAGFLDASDVTPEMQAFALDYVRRTAKSQQALTSSLLNVVKKVHKTPQSIEDKLIFFDSGALPMSPAQLAQLHAKQAVKRSDADIFVVPNLGEIPNRTRLIAGLVGGVVSTMEFVASRGASGSTVAFSGSAFVPRKLYICPGFMVKYPWICSDIYDVLNLVTAKLKLAKSEAEVEGILANVATRARRQREIIVLCSKAEK